LRKISIFEQNFHYCTKFDYYCTYQLISSLLHMNVHLAKAALGCYNSKIRIYHSHNGIVRLPSIRMYPNENILVSTRVLHKLSHSWVNLRFCLIVPIFDRGWTGARHFLVQFLKLTSLRWASWYSLSASYLTPEISFGVEEMSIECTKFITKIYTCELS